VKQFPAHQVELHETYIKQTYRNRCTILGANGPLDLVIPVKKPMGSKTKTSEIIIDYREDWQRIHWYAIESAYNSSPFFEFYQDYLAEFYTNKIELLVDFNQQLHVKILKLLKLQRGVSFTSEFQKHPSSEDFRYQISPKLQTGHDFREYYQVFSYKSHFVDNLSVIDLIFNEGPRAQEFI